MRAAGAHKIDVAQIRAASGQIGDVKIDNITLGSAHIGRLVLSGTSVNLRSGSAFMRNVRTVTELKFALEWWYDVFLDSDSGTENLGSLFFPVNIGDVAVPALTNIPLSIPNVTAANIATNIAPINNFGLGGGSFAGVDAANASLPADSFQLGGLGLASLGIESVGVPRTAVANANIQEFRPNGNVVVPEVRLGPLQIPSASVADIRATAAINMDAIASRRSLPEFSLGIAGFTLSVTPIVHVSIGSMLLSGVTASASVNQATVQNVSVPVNVRGIHLKAINVGQIDVSDIRL